MTAGPSNPRATVEAYADALDRHDVSALADVVAPDVLGHEPAGDVIGRDALERNIASWLTTYPDMRLVTDDVFASGDRVAWRWSLTGTHAGVGRVVSTSGIILFRLSGDRIVEYWGQYDRLGVQQQLLDD